VAADMAGHSALDFPPESVSGPAGKERPRRRRSGGVLMALRRLLLRLLYLFWGCVAVGGLAGVVVLELLPTGRLNGLVAGLATEPATLATGATPSPTAPKPAEPVSAKPEPPPVQRAMAAAAPISPTTTERPRPSQRVTDSNAILPPDPMLLEPSDLTAGERLPRIAADNRAPMRAYAAPFNTADLRPRVAILLAGIGMNEADSLAASAILPPQISFAVSPYAHRPEKLLSEFRTRGHEFLVSVPMEPQGYPLNDPGNHALLTSASLASNLQQLQWSLTRFAGYVGVTGALGSMRGERFAAASDQMAPVLDMLADRGLLYIDPRSNMPRLSGSTPQSGALRAVDLVLDDAAGKSEIDARLAWLEIVAKDRGSALGLAGRPSPVTVDRIATWAANLSSRGLSLAPASVVVQMPVVSAAPPRTGFSP